MTVCRRTHRGARRFASCLVAGLASLTAPAALAQSICDDLWFSRNTAFDRAGFCFSSPLGQAVFDNDDCTTTDPRISTADAERIERIIARESRLGCNIDVNRTVLEVPAIADRRLLTVQPIAAETETLCVGFVGRPVAMRTGPARQAEVLGTIEPGDTLFFTHLPEGGWNFVSALRRDGVDIMRTGWTDDPIALCEARAG